VHQGSIKYAISMNLQFSLRNFDGQCPFEQLLPPISERAKGFDMMVVLSFCAALARPKSGIARWTVRVYFRVFKGRFTTSCTRQTNHKRYRR
jgi:hypothetical protein